MPKCTTEQFIEKARKIHGDKYDYSKVEYKNSQTKVCIICPVHGEFWQTPNSHLNGRGCRLCGIETLAHQFADTQELLIKKFTNAHGGKYDYSKVDYKNMRTKVCIICPIHGEFWMLPINHLKGQNCPKCAQEARRRKPYTTSEFVEKAKSKHNNDYDYSEVNYIDSKTKVCIICPIHGKFWMTPSNHLFGKRCPRCKQSNLERIVFNLLQNNNLEFEFNKKYEWLNNLTLDFYLPEYNIAIECQGVQHFKPTDFGGKGAAWADSQLESTQERDKQKLEACIMHGTHLLYFTDQNYITFLERPLLKNTDDLLTKINELKTCAIEKKLVVLQH